MRSFCSGVTLRSFEIRIIFQAFFIERNERIFLAVLVGYLFRFQTVTEIHTEFVQRHAPVSSTRGIYIGILILRPAEVEIHWHRCHCFQLCNVDRIGVVRTCGESCQLAGKSCFFITDRNRALRTCPSTKDFIPFRLRFVKFGLQFWITFICLQCLLSGLEFCCCLVIGIRLSCLFQVIPEIAPLFSSRVIPRHETVAVRDRMSADGYAAPSTDNRGIIAQCGSKICVFYSREITQSGPIRRIFYFRGVTQCGREVRVCYIRVRTDRRRISGRSVNGGLRTDSDRIFTVDFA